MGRRQGSHHQSRALAAALLAFALGGCATSSGVQGNWNVNTFFAFGLLLGATYGPAYGAPEMDPNRRVVEQDCSKPIEDTTANLKCR